MGGCVATARRHSLLSLPCLLVNYNELRVPRSGTYIMKPTASCEAAPLWVRVILPPHIVPRRGTDTSRMMLRMIVGPASRNHERVGRIVYPTAALLRSLQWVSDEYVSPRDTALIEVLCYGRLQANEVIYAMGGCGATARRHSLLCLPCLL